MMNLSRVFTKEIRCFALFAVLFMTGTAFAQNQTTGILRGQVTDNFGAVIIGATVTVVGPAGNERTATTNEEGSYIFAALPPGVYTLRATAQGFNVYENTTVNIAPGRREPLNIQLSAALEREEVTVAAEGALNTDPANNADTVVLRSRDLDALPDDPEELAAALQALAGPSAGPNGGQIYIDGFTGGRLPPRETIREVRFNQNPFSAENDFPFGGRIDILTKPGTDRLRGSAFFGFADESLNSRNPFVPNRAPYQFRNYGGNLSGTVVKQKASFFLDFERNETDDNDIINARILDSALNVTPFSLAVLTPQRFLTFSPRFDYQLNTSNTLIGRYSFTRRRSIDQFPGGGGGFGGFGGGASTFSLLERAFDSANTQHLFQITETAVLSQRAVNETRFQFVRDQREQIDDNPLPTVNVQDAFIAGGAGIGMASSEENRYELQNYTTLALGTHSVKFGGRLRGVQLTDISPSNFRGTLLFTSLEQYRQVLLGVPGARPAQFTINGGNPTASVSQVDFGGFVQDDWRVRPDLTLSYGLRYETQTNIKSPFNFAPRLAFAYSPGAGGGGRARTVIRGGAGIYYNRISENFTLTEERFNGLNQQSYIVTDPVVLDTIRFTADRMPVLPSIESLAAFAQRQVTRRVAENMQAPYSFSANFGIEQQLPANFTGYLQYGVLRSRHLPRLRNINAPLPGTFVFGQPRSGVRPFGDVGDIYLYESSGNFNFNRLSFGFRNQLNRNISLNADYSYSRAFADVDASPFFASTFTNFPVNSYDLSGEYAPTTFPRHRFFLFGNFSLPLGFNVTPIISASSGRRFNITLGRDLNGDRQFNERPAFANDLTRPTELRETPFGRFDLNPKPGQEIIPRNFGHGPESFTVNLNISKRFGFGSLPGANSAGASAQQPAQGGDAGGGRGGRVFGGGRGPGGGPGGGGGGPFGGFGGGSSEKRYNLTFSLQVQNLFNRVNADVPVGNLSSPLFGFSTRTAGGFGPGGGSVAGNRTLRAQVRFNF